MYLVVGLGNPGEKYSNTKHNIGFIAIDQLAERHGIKVSKRKFKAHIGEGQIAGKKVILAKPQTFMNESGRSLIEIINYYGIEIENVFVIYDDADLPMGSLRIRGQGSAGSHNGMRSIIYLLERDEFPRFRIGIGTDPDGSPLRAHVLSGFKKEDMDDMRNAVIRCVDAIETALSDGLEMSMLRFNYNAKIPENE